jgi:hypothetical protein
MRCCTKCGEEKEFTEFNKSKSGKFGYTEQCKTCRKLTYLNTQVVVKARASQWKKNNPQKRLENNRRWRENNLELSRKYGREWAARNKNYSNAQASKYRATRLQANVSWDNELTDFCMQEAYDLLQRRCMSTKQNWDIDHIIPLKGKTACGLHVWNNFQVIPSSLNRSKGNRHDTRYRWTDHFR